MVNLIELTTAMVATFQKIPPLVALLDQGAASIVGYIDENPLKNSTSKAVYQMAAGSLLVVWIGTSIEASDAMLAWSHVIQIYIRAQRGASALTIINALIDGVPVPGDGLRWRYCPILDGTLPTEVRDTARLVDEEGIDYFVVTTVTQETSDTEPIILTAEGEAI